MAEAHEKSPNDQDVAVVPIFRFEGDKAVELREVGQLLSKDSPMVAASLLAR
jgi:hypothetical protein